jgi:hypothetical protein
MSILANVLSRTLSPSAQLEFSIPSLGQAAWLSEPTGWPRLCLSRTQIGRSHANIFRLDLR